jgi:hypothetical protein
VGATTPTSINPPARAAAALRPWAACWPRPGSSAAWGRPTPAAPSPCTAWRAARRTAAPNVPVEQCASCAAPSAARAHRPAVSCHPHSSLNSGRAAASTQAALLSARSSLGRFCSCILINTLHHRRPAHFINCQAPCPSFARVRSGDGEQSSLRCSKPAPLHRWQNG